MAESLPIIESATQLRRVLESELGYCTCALAGAVPLLRDVLRLAKSRSESTGDFQVFTQRSHELDERLQIGTTPGLASWFIYSLDRAKLVGHNYNITDLWITDKGRALLEALDQFPDPSLLEAGDGGDAIA